MSLESDTRQMEAEAANQRMPTTAESLGMWFVMILSVPILIVALFYANGFF